MRWLWRLGAERRLPFLPCRLKSSEYLGAAPRLGWRRRFIWDWGFCLFLFLKKNKKEIVLEKWHFYRFAPKLWSGSWCKQHGGTYSCLRSFTGWYWDRKTSAKWDNSIWSVYYRHQNGGVREFPVSDFLVFWCLIYNDLISHSWRRCLGLFRHNLQNAAWKKEPLLCRVGRPILGCSQHL